MSLLELALEAHGGLTRWSQLKTVSADISVTGALWQIKGQAGTLQQIRIEAELHRQKLSTHFHSQDKRTTFTPDSITLQTEGGRLLQSRRNPRLSSSGQILNSPWDELHVHIVLSRIIVDADGCKPKFQHTPKKRPQLKSKGLRFKEIQMALRVQVVKC
jgi:hypothetical protein